MIRHDQSGLAQTGRPHRRIGDDLEDCCLDDENCQPELTLVVYRSARFLCRAWATRNRWHGPCQLVSVKQKLTPQALYYVQQQVH